MLTPSDGDKVDGNARLVWLVAGATRGQLQTPEDRPISRPGECYDTGPVTRGTASGRLLKHVDRAPNGPNERRGQLIEISNSLFVFGARQHLEQNRAKKVLLQRNETTREKTSPIVNVSPNRKFFISAQQWASCAPAQSPPKENSAACWVSGGGAR